jgi:hypothetical protein
MLCGSQSIAESLRRETAPNRLFGFHLTFSVAEAGSHSQLAFRSLAL